MIESFEELPVPFLYESEIFFIVNRCVLYYKIQKILLNLLRSTMTYQGKERVLSKNEFSILYYLIKNQGRIVSRDELMDYLWDCNDFIDDNTLTVNINRLRKKLEEAGIQGAIQTRRGQGYLLL